MPTIRTIALVLILAVTRAKGEATLSLKAIAKNGVLITPTNNLTVAPNDTIVAEVAFSGWSTPPFDDPANTGLVQTFQATLLGAAGVISNGADPADTARLVLPVGWDAPIVKDHCPCNDPKYPNCDSDYGCVGPTHNPSLMANLNVVCNENDTDLIGGTCLSACCFSSFRSDFIFYGFANQAWFTAPQSLNIRWGGTIDGFDAQQSQRCYGGANFGGFCNVTGDCPGGTCDANFQSYAGTLALKVGAHACGTYTFTFSNDVNQTFISNAAANPVSRVPVNIQGLTLCTGFVCSPNLGACCDELAVPYPVCNDCLHPSACTGPGKRWGGFIQTCATMNPPCGSFAPTGACCFVGNCGAVECNDDVLQQDCSDVWTGAGSTCATTVLCPLGPPIIVTEPPNCIIDARRPFPPNEPTQREGFTALRWQFYGFPGTDEDDPNDFAVRQVPSTTPPVPPTITSVTWGSGLVSLHLSEPIQANKWTCIKHNASGCERCLGYLPGDVNGNRTAMPSDILALIDHLNQVPGAYLPVHTCDIDRSGQCLPADIITEIDLLIGNGFFRQSEKTLPPCPSTTP